MLTFFAFRTVEALKKQLGNKKDANSRERALNAIKAIAEHSETSAAVEPYLVVLLPSVLAAVGDKMVPVKNAAQETALSIVKAVNANAVKAVLPPIINSILTAQKWQEKITGLHCIEALVKSSPIQLALRVPDLIPVVSESMWDTKPEVKKMAYGTMEKVCGLIVNKDIERFIPELIKCIAKPENVPETVHLLGATTFVTDVHEPTLAIMVPLLDRGLAERETAIKRKSAVIVDNMCKLVEDPQIVAAFLPKLMPGLTKNYENLADPEAREKTKQGLDTLVRVGAVKDGKIPEVSHAGDVSTVLEILKSVLSTKHKDAVTKFAASLEYVSAIAGQLIDEKDSDSFVWTQNLKPYLAAIVGDNDAQGIVDALRKRASPGAEEEDAEEADDEEGEDLCNCTFNLAYGAKILLNQTHLRLKRGQRYGLCGPNGSGKSTLAKLITGLYIPQKGKILLNGQPITNQNREAYRQLFTAIFADFYLFDRILGINLNNLDDRATKYLQKLELNYKVEVSEGIFSTTDLSQGQRKRLALLVALLEDRPIYLFDEWASDQDPHFREIFYKQILMELKVMGKIVLVISHDDRYFHLADRIVKLDYGQFVTN